MAKAQGIQTAAQRGDSGGMNKELAGLLGWEHLYDINDNDGTLLSSYGRPPNERPECFKRLPAYDTDLNAMRGAWKVLKERGLWDSFKDAWFAQLPIEDTAEVWEYRFFTDLPGQVEAAIKVLKK